MPRRCCWPIRWKATCGSSPMWWNTINMEPSAYITAITYRSRFARSEASAPTNPPLNPPPGRKRTHPQRAGIQLIGFGKTARRRKRWVSSSLLPQAEKEMGSTGYIDPASKILKTRRGTICVETDAQPDAIHAIRSGRMTAEYAARTRASVRQLGTASLNDHATTIHHIRIISNTKCCPRILLDPGSTECPSLRMV